MGTAQSYKASFIKRRRRTKQEMDDIKAAIYMALAEDHPQTVRQIFYRLVVGGVIDKTDNEYNNTVVRQLSIMRRDGSIPWGWISDYSRVMRKPQTYAGLSAYFERGAEAYRRALWDTSDTYIEIWTEKETLTGVLHPVTREWDVPLMPARGFSSLTFLQSAAETIREHTERGRSVFIYQFGDHDPSGVVAAQKVEEGLREFSGDSPFTFERVAVTEDQIIDMQLPTRPTKSTDTRARNFTGESVEVEAIPAAVLRELCQDCITRHVDQERLQSVIEAERSERELLYRMSRMARERFS